MKKAIIINITLCMGSLILQAQTNADSLVNILNSKETDSREKIELYQKICAVYMDNDNEKFYTYSKEGLDIAEKEKDLPAIAKFYQNLSIYMTTIGVSDTALIYIEKAISLAKESGNKSIEAETYNTKGGYHRSKQEYDKAIEYYLKTLDIAKNENFTNLKMKALNNIGGVHCILKDFDVSEKYLLEANNMAIENNDLYIQMTSSYYLGSISQKRRDLEKAIEYGNIVNKLSKILQDKRYEVTSLYLMISIYKVAENFEMANKYAEECLSLARKIGEKRLLIGVLNNVSNIYFDQKYYEKSAELSQEAWNLDPEDLIYADGAALHITLCHIMSGDKEKAVQSLKEFYSIKEEYKNKSFHDAISEIEIKYETEKKEIHIATLEKERLIYLWIGIATAILLLFAFFALFYRNRLVIQKRRVAEQQKELAEKQMVLAEQQREIAEKNNKLAKQQIKQLEKEKQLIATQAVLDGETTERSRLAKELHDRLGSLLTIITLNLKEITGYSNLEKQDVNRFEKALELLDQSVVELRRIAHHLMPDSLIRYGLRTAIEDFCIAIPTANFKYYGSDMRLDNRLEIVLYQSAYELMNNAIKYSEATAINVQLLIDNGLVSLTIQDNGKGFDPDKKTTGTGLNNIQARVSAFNGKMNIHSSPGNGTEVCIEIEIKKMANLQIS